VQPRERQSLRTLAPGNQVRFFVMLFRLKVWEELSFLPFTTKLGVVHGGVLFALLCVLPQPPDLPPAGIPVAWAAAYCVALSLAMHMPLRRRLIHWVQS
jgi:hypothetical protein